MTARIGGRAWAALRTTVFDTYGTRCWMCGREGADTIDHLLERSRGGTNDITNLRPAHGRKQPWGCPGNYGRSGRRRPTRGITWSSPGW